MDGVEQACESFQKIDLRQRFTTGESDAAIIFFEERFILAQLGGKIFCGDGSPAEASAALWADSYACAAYHTLLWILTDFSARPTMLTN